jgi:hypothetical protein
MPIRRIALASLAALLGVAAVGFANLGTVFLALTAPRTPFDPAQAPAPPRYEDAATWSALPSTDAAADVAIAGLGAAAEPEADVFYLHPTSYLGRGWNAPLDDASVNAATDRGATRIQASAFQGCCRVFAPRYRQANMTAFTAPSADGARAIALAGDDAVAAFRFYLAHWNGGRPFLVAAHSQGSILAPRVLEEIVAAPGVRERLVAAYLIGSALGEAEAAALLPACDAPAQTGCIVAFNARSETYRDGLEQAPVDGRLCVNPLTWRHDEVAAPASQSRGAVFFDGDRPLAPQPGYASARCESGVLRVALAGRPPRNFASRLLDHALGAGNYHPIEYGIFFVDLRENAATRVQALVAARKPPS